MTFAQLADDCWHELPTVRKWLAGRAAVTRILADAVREFDPDAAAGDDYAETLLQAVTRRNRVGGCSRCDDRDGFAIAIFLLSVVAAAVISWLIQRWLDNKFPKPQLDAWREELAA